MRLEFIDTTLSKNTALSPVTKWVATMLHLHFVESGPHLEVHALLALQDADEFTRDDTPLVNELVEGMLTIGSRLPKVYLTRLKGQPGPINCYSLAIALHRHLNAADSVECLCHCSRNVDCGSVLQYLLHHEGSCNHNTWVDLMSTCSDLFWHRANSFVNSYPVKSGQPVLKTWEAECTSLAH